MSRSRFAARYATTACFCLAHTALCTQPLLEYFTEAQEAQPSAGQQQQMLDAMRDYADTYITKLPDFVCEQVTRQFQAGANGKHWRKGDTLTSKLVFVGGREERTLELVNNKRSRYGAARRRTPLSTEGEFGILLNKIFDPASNASFTWAAWEDFHGKRLAKFNYSINREHSTLVLINYIKATVPYHGSVYADSDTGAIWKLASATAEIPPALQMNSIETAIDYDHVRIGDNAYLLPVRAEVLLITDRDQVRHEIGFESYRKFEAESTITFGEESGEPYKPTDRPHGAQR